MEHAESMWTERRRHRRVPALCAVELSSRDKRGRFGVTRDASGRGLRIVTPSRFAVGDELEVGVYLSGAETRLRGQVVRVEETSAASDEIWRYQLSVALADPLPDDRIAVAAAVAARY